MKFFSPHTDDPEHANRIRAVVMEFLASQGCAVEGRKIWRISFRHNGKAYDLKVGEQHPDLREDVLFIFQAKHPGLYYACTAHRGVASGGPYLIGDGVDTFAVDFEAE
jgi:hypothetical protein